MNDRYLFVFAITIFFLLSITGAGIFLNDEWLVGQQLNQLSQGHQVLYNEGKYGYFMNGTPSQYVESRGNLLIYSMALPILSLPASFIFSLLGTDFTRYAIMILWFMIGFYCISFIHDNKLRNGTLIALAIASIISFIIYEPFPMSGPTIPYEIIPIVFTNIILMGIFSILALKISEILFPKDNIKQIVGWITSLSCSSLLFWAGTLKDHVLLATLVLAICYFQLASMKTGIRRYQIYALLLTGLSAWIRPEVGVFIAIPMVIYNIRSTKTILLDFINGTSWILLGSLPLFLNNLILTGNPLKSPFLLSKASGTMVNLSSGNMIDVFTTAAQQIPIAQTTEFSLKLWATFFFAPESGAIGCIAMLSIFIFSLLTIIRYKQKISSEVKFMIALGGSSLLYYLLFSGAYLSRDGGVIPDIRYFTPAYALFSLAALSILPYKLNYRKILKNIVIYVPTILIISICIISMYTPIGETYKTFRIIPEIIAVATFAIMVLFLVNNRKLEAPLLEKIIPIAISSVLSWQIILIFIYDTSKAHFYPMFIPIVELIHKIIFGG